MELNDILTGIYVRSRFKEILEKIESFESQQQENMELLEEAQEFGNRELCPELIVKSSLLKEEIECFWLLKKLVVDIIELDWTKPETYNQFQGMKKCFEAMSERHESLSQEVEIIILGKPVP
jgi:hypothetical protein